MNNQWRDNAHRTVLWADGTYDTQRSCAVCDMTPCQMPIHTERYKEVGAVALEEKDADIEAAGYWSWMQDKGPLGRKNDHDGGSIVEEFNTANPDNLPEGVERGSGISQEVTEWMGEAYERLTKAQKEVWDAVMREQISQTALANKLGITERAVAKRLKGAKVSVTNYLRSKQENDKA